MALSSLNPNHTAILSIDLQSGIVSIYTRGETLVIRAAELLQNAREAGCTIIHVKAGFAVRHRNQWSRAIDGAGCCRC